MQPCTHAAVQPCTHAAVHLRIRMRMRAHGYGYGYGYGYRYASAGSRSCIRVCAHSRAHARPQSRARGLRAYRQTDIRACELADMRICGHAGMQTCVSVPCMRAHTRAMRAAAYPYVAHACLCTRMGPSTYVLFQIPHARMHTQLRMHLNMNTHINTHLLHAGPAHKQGTCASASACACAYVVSLSRRRIRHTRTCAIQSAQACADHQPPAQPTHARAHHSHTPTGAWVRP
jgi:hypothetical protein